MYFYLLEEQSPLPDLFKPPLPKSQFLFVNENAGVGRVLLFSSIIVLSEVEIVVLLLLAVIVSEGTLLSYCI